MKLTIYRTDAHDHAVGLLDGRLLFANDYGYQNLLQAAKRLDWELEEIMLSREEYERLEIFAD